MSSPLESLLQGLQGPAAREMAGRLGADEDSVRNAATAALPVLLAAMARNASSDEGARALQQTGGGSTAARVLTGLLDRDGDGRVLDDAGDLLKGFLRRR